MGMYTGLRFKGVVKPEFRETFESIALEGKWEDSNYPLFSEFGNQYGRASFIPCGALSYMPDEWDNDPEFKRYWNAETGEWIFQCSLKNYEGEIQKWLKMIPYFIDEIEHLEYLYEESTRSSLYNFVDGELKIVDSIQYYSED